MSPIPDASKGRSTAWREPCGNFAFMHVAPLPPNAIERLQNGKRRILHVDDDHDMVSTLAALLEDMGHAVAVTTDSTQALAIAQQFRPEIIFLDIGMPQLDGYQLCKTFRANPGFKDVRIVAISAYGDEADRQESRRAGFDAHVQKPVDLAVLNSILTHFGKSLERRAAPRG